MNDAEIALEYAKNKKKNRLNKNIIYHRMGRFKAHICSCSKDSMNTESCVISNLNSITIASNDENNKNQLNDLLSPLSNLDESNPTEKVDESALTSYNYDFSNLMHYQQPDNLNLHIYTSINCLSFSQNIINFIRKANISKSHAQQLVDLIQSGLPQPNNLPNNYLDMLKLLSGFKTHCFFFFN